MSVTPLRHQPAGRHQLRGVLYGPHAGDIRRGRRWLVLVVLSGGPPDGRSSDRSVRHGWDGRANAKLVGTLPYCFHVSPCVEVAPFEAKTRIVLGILVLRVVQSLVAATLRERGRSLTVLRRVLRQGARALRRVRKKTSTRDQGVTRRET